MERLLDVSGVWTLTDLQILKYIILYYNSKYGVSKVFFLKNKSLLITKAAFIWLKYSKNSNI